MPHVIHDVVSGPLEAMGGQLQFDAAQVYHCSHACKQMTPDLAVSPVPDRTETDSILVIAYPEPVFNLPAVYACFQELPGAPVDFPVVLGVATAHHGDVTVDSMPGKGSVFRVFPPLLMGS